MSTSQSLIDIVKHEQGHFDPESVFILDLSSRNLTDANSLSVCRNLVILNLNNNSLTNVRGFGMLTQLKVLSMARNQISSLESLQSCESLESLNVAGNLLIGLKSLAPLLHLVHLRSLCLADRQANLSNPLCDSASYRQDVKNNLSNLDTLDNEWLGQGFQERLSALQNAVEELEHGDSHRSTRTVQKEENLITSTNQVAAAAAAVDRSVHLANDEYEQLLQTIEMLVK